AGGAMLQSSATFSRSTGGRAAPDAAAPARPLSRQGASPHLPEAHAEAHLTHEQPAEFRVDLIGRAQAAFGKPLLVSEQFSLDGPQAISAYPSGTLNVDQGGTWRGELSRPFAVPGSVTPLILSPYGFGVLGAGRLVDPTIVEVA